MSQSVDDLAAEMLQDTSRWFLRDETLKAANAILVDYHHHLPLSHIWETAAARLPTGSALRSNATACSAASIPAISAITTARSPSIPTLPTSTASTPRG